MRIPVGAEQGVLPLLCGGSCLLGLLLLRLFVPLTRIKGGDLLTLQQGGEHHGDGERDGEGGIDFSGLTITYHPNAKQDDDQQHSETRKESAIVSECLQAGPQV